MKVKISFILLSFTALLSCGGGSEGGEDTTPIVQQPVIPVAPQLQFPFKDELCTTGIFIEDNKSKVEFLWKVAANANSYTLRIKDQSTNNPDADIILSNLKTAKALVTIKQNAQYRWTVEAVSRTGQKAESEEWLMYNAAQGVQNYAPFPALLNSPENGITVTNLTPILKWTGNDVDNDIKEYEILLDTNTPPTISNDILNKGNEEKTLSGLLAGTKYYWQIITRDDFGNATKSEIKEFMTP